MMRSSWSFRQDLANGMDPLEVLYRMGKDGLGTGLVSLGIGLLGAAVAVAGWTSFDTGHVLLLFPLIFGALGFLYAAQGISQMRTARRCGWRKP